MPVVSRMSAHVARPKSNSEAQDLELLEQTANPAATVLLGSGLTHPNSDVRHRSLRALVARDAEAANMLVLTHWNVYDNRDLSFLRAKARQFVPAVRTMLSRGSNPVKAMVLRAISQLDLCESADVLLELALNSKHPLNGEATKCLLEMCEAWGNASRMGLTRAESLRPHLVQTLYNELLRLPDNELILKAWLSVVHWEDGQQRSLIADPSQPAYSRMLAVFSESDKPAILQLLAGYFWRSTTPNSIQSILREQASPILIVELAKLVSNEQLESVLNRLKSTPALACVQHVDVQDYPLDSADYRRLLLMVAASKEDAGWALSTCSRLSKQTSSESRKLAGEVLIWSRNAGFEKLVGQLHNDETNNNGSAAMRYVREILEWKKHPSVVLRQAVTGYFKEFTVENLLRFINHWPARMCRVMSEIVAVIDPNRLITLENYLASPAPKKRLAALQAVEYLQCADMLKDRILSLLSDPRIEVRVRVIDTLSALNDESLAGLLPDLLKDANTDVVDAASRAKKRLKLAEA